MNAKDPGFRCKLSDAVVAPVVVEHVKCCVYSQNKPPRKL